MTSALYKNARKMSEKQLIQRLEVLNHEIGQHYEEYLEGGSAWGMIVLDLEEMLAIANEMYAREQP